MSSRKGGDANPKQKRFARILDYLEVNNKPLYNMYSWLGMQTSLTPKRGGGVTLLVPDKKMLDEIEKLSLSDDAAKATDFLSGIVVQDYLGSAKDWAEKQDDIPNLLGKRIQVKSVSAGKVVLEGGAELTLDTSAKFLERVGNRKRDPMAVWIVKGSFDPVSGPDATFKYVGKGGKAKEGGRKRGGLATNGSEESNKYIRRVVGDFKTDKYAFMKENAKVAQYLCKNKDTDLAKLVFELPAWDHMSRFFLTFDNDFYINSLLRDDLVRAVEAEVEPQNCKDALDEFYALEWSEECLKATQDGRKSLKSECERVSDQLLQKSAVRFGDSTNDVFVRYATENKIGNKSNVSFAVVQRKHAESKGMLKQLMSYFDYYVRQYRKNHGDAAALEFADRKSNSLNNTQGLDTLKNYFNNFGSWAPGKQEEKKHGAGFVRSDAFLPVTRTSGEVMGAGEYDEDEAENPFSRELKNDDALGVDETDSAPTSEFQISNRALNELAAYKAKFGKMPDVQ